MDAMAFEVRILAFAGLLAAVQLLLMAVPANVQLGSKYVASARDTPRPLSGIPARLQRAFQNHMEGLVLFAVAVVVVTLGGASSPLTEGCALAYLAARLVYIPLYAFGVPYLRSLVWAIGSGATVVMLGSAVL